MTNGGTTAAVAAAAAIAQAIKASGAIVKVESEAFRILLAKAKDPLVIYTQGGIFRKDHRYLLGYKGFVFYTISDRELELPGGAEVLTAEKIWVPG